VLTKGSPPAPLEGVEAAIVAGINAAAGTIAGFFLGTPFSFLLGSDMPYAHDNERGGARVPPTEVEHLGGLGAAWKLGRATHRSLLGRFWRSRTS
jgi:hypothetical protein